jgi:hypothetical protein
MRKVVLALTAMPLILRLTVLATVCTGAALLVVTAFRIGSFRIYDERLSGQELWSEGYGPFFLIIALLMLTAGLGMLKGRRWSRWLLLFLYVPCSPVLLIYSRHRSREDAHLTWGFAISALLWAAFYYWYLFHKQKQFFA